MDDEQTNQEIHYLNGNDTDQMILSDANQRNNDTVTNKIELGHTKLPLIVILFWSILKRQIQGQFAGRIASTNCNCAMCCDIQ